jgi:hypothetical protein
MGKKWNPTIFISPSTGPESPGKIYLMTDPRIPDSAIGQHEKIKK